MKFVSKPVEIEAYQWDGKFTDIVEHIPAGMRGLHCIPCDCELGERPHGVVNHDIFDEGLPGKTLCVGDWVVTAPDELIAAWSVEMFEETYEPA